MCQKKKQLIPRILTNKEYQWKMTNLVINSIWFQLALLAFTSVFLTNNIVLIRLLLITGDCLLLLNSILGWPFWPDVKRDTDEKAWDTIFWSSLNIVLNSVVLFKFYRDKRKNATDNGNNTTTEVDRV